MSLSSTQNHLQCKGGGRKGKTTTKTGVPIEKAGVAGAHLSAKGDVGVVQLAYGAVMAQTPLGAPRAHARAPEATGPAGHRPEAARTACKSSAQTDTHTHINLTPC